MSNFCTLLQRKERHYSDPGSREANDYTVIIDKKGHKTLKITGTHDVYEEIQSYAEECKIENILARAAAGDQDILNQKQGFYADITETPKDLFEAQNSILKLKKGFDELPAEVREKFDNSAEAFINAFGSNEWAEKMGYKENEAEKVQKVDFVPGTTDTNNEILTPEE